MQPVLKSFAGIFVDEVSGGILVDPSDKGLFLLDDKKIAVNHGKASACVTWVVVKRYYRWTAEKR